LAVEQKEKIIVGVNEYSMTEEPAEVSLLQIGESVAELQRVRLEKLRGERDDQRVRRSLSELAEGARSGENTMPLLLDCARAYATLGEMCDTLRPVFGEYAEPSF
jgi:methylmalonyl-CoA mutase N-terminal domain/subunit